MKNKTEILKLLDRTDECLEKALEFGLSIQEMLREEDETYSLPYDNTSLKRLMSAGSTIRVAYKSLGIVRKNIQ